jgi:hypothetical protein
VNGLGCSFSVLTELFKVVDGHQYSGQLCNFTQLLARSLLLSILQLALLVFNLLRVRLKSIDLIIKRHDVSIHLAFVCS